mgnify:CR=1 FL=1
MDRAALSSEKRSHVPKLVVVLLCCCLVCDWFATRVRHQAEAAQSLRGLHGCEIVYNNETRRPYDFEFHVREPGQALPEVKKQPWTERLLGKDFVHGATKVGVTLDQIDKALPHLERLPYLREVLIRLPDLPDSDEAQTVERSRVAIAKIKEALPRVEVSSFSFDFQICAEEESKVEESLPLAGLRSIGDDRYVCDFEISASQQLPQQQTSYALAWYLSGASEIWSYVPLVAVLRSVF